MLDYLARRVGSDERDAIEVHIDTCSACRELLAELARSTQIDELVARDTEAEPAQIGRYRIEARLGEGGMGTVYAAYDPQLERRVALKLVHPELALRGGLERLLREGRALARLAHPNVVGVYDADVDGGRVYIAMELVEGESLATWLRAERRDWRAIVDKFVAAGRGLAAAHGARIVHRDVKPENILLDAQGRPKVADFGLAGEAAPAPITTEVDVEPDAAGENGRLTRPGSVMGTPMFMSPEQRRGDEVGPATDQYALSAALWNALFDGEPRRRVPRWLVRALERGLAREPADRHPAIDDLIAAIDPARHERRARRVATAAAAAIAVGGVASAAVWYASREPDQDADVAAACRTAEHANTAMWAPRDRDAVHAALRATSVAYAEETWTRVDAALARNQRELGAAVAALCDRAPKTREARDAFTAGLACLADRRDNSTALVARLRHVPAADVHRAVEMVHALPTIEDCANPVVLAAERAASAMPGGPAARAQVKAAVASARAAYAEGQFQAAVAEAARAVAAARPLGGMFLAGALIVHGDFAMPIDATVAEAAYREAVSAAESVHADDIRALGLMRLMGAIGATHGREREALALEPIVTAAVRRTTKQEALLPALHLAVGLAKFRLGQTEAALVELEAAVARARELMSSADPRLPDYLYPLGIALGVVGRDREALAAHEESVRIATEAYGPDHPQTARFMVNLATKRVTLGQCDPAVTDLLKARQRLAPTLPADSFELLQIAQTLGECYVAQQQHDAALREHRRSQDALVAAGHANSVEMASTWVDVGDVHFDREAWTAANAAYRRAVALYEELVGRDDSRLALPLSRIGEVELARRHAERAIAPLERAAAIYERTGSPPNVVAVATFPLARALWSTRRDRARARALAEQARAALAQAGDRRADEIATWLASR